MIHDVILPRSGSAMMESAVVGGWDVKLGDRVRRDQPIATVETEKVEFEIEAPVSGWIVEICAGSGEVVPVGEVIARIAESEDERDEWLAEYLEASNSEVDHEDR